MLDDVGQRLLDEPVDGRLQSRAASRSVAVVRARRRRRPRAVASRPVRSRQRRERRRQPELVERRRAQLGDQRAQRLAISRRSAAGRLAQAVAHRLGVARVRAQRRREQHLQAAERLQRLVVQLARPALALLLGRGQRCGAGASASTDWAVATAVAALAANDLQQLLVARRRTRGSPSRRSKAASTPRRCAAVDERHQQRGRGVGRRRAVGRDRELAAADVGDALARGPRRSTSPGDRPVDRDAAAAPTSAICTSPAPAATTSSSPSRSMIRTRAPRRARGRA